MLSTPCTTFYKYFVKFSFHHQGIILANSLFHISRPYWLPHSQESGGTQSEPCSEYRGWGTGRLLWFREPYWLPH